MLRPLPFAFLFLSACGPDKDDTGAPVDADGDGWTQPDDCDDTDPDVHPDAVEQCDGIDNDCDGEIDGAEATGGPVWFADADADSYGDPASQLRACEQPSGYVSNDSDCDDGQPTAYPGADEVCDGLDNDCNGLSDEDTALDVLTWYADADADGYGNAERTMLACDQPSGHAERDGDCDDRNAAINPEADEVCDGADNDCDGVLDEPDAIDAPTWYIDADADGYGSEADSTTACTHPSGYASTTDDCDDGDAEVNPGRFEECDGVDNDCDGETDEPDALDASTWYADADADGYGDAADAVDACFQPSGYTDNSLDCDDDDSAINPDALEVCDGIDNDCKSYTTEDGIVSLDGASNYGRIQAAVEDASSGSSIVVCDGSYLENLVIDLDLSISSLNGSGSTELDGDRRDATISIEHGEVTIEGLFITRGAGADNPYGGTGSLGGGVFVQSSDPVTIRDCVISDNTADYGGGILAGAGADLSLIDVEIENNEGDMSGGGLYISSATVQLVGVDVVDNSGPYGGGLLIEDSEVIADTVLVDQNSGTYGGGAYVIDASLVATDTIIARNEATDIGGGLLVVDDAVVQGPEVNTNDAVFGAGVALLGDTGVPSLAGLSVSRNGASSNGGGLWAYSAAGDMLVTDIILAGNTAAMGAGLAIEGGHLALEACSLTDNMARVDGGGAYLYGEASMSSNASDWGSASGGDDNSPDDVYIGEAALSYDAYGGGETFDCDSGGCY
jgi:hypothetical protein